MVHLHDDAIDAAERYFVQPAVAEGYDRYIGRNIPFYHHAMDHAVATAARLVGAEALRAGLVTEFGAGTANLSAAFAGFGVRRFTLVDHSDAMLRLASRKLAGAAVTALRGDMAALDRAALDACRGSSVLAYFLTLDHIASDQRVSAMLAAIRPLLAPGGVLLIAEKCANSDRDSASWKSFRRMIEVREAHLLREALMTPPQAAAWRRHILEEDHLRPLAVLARLAEAQGFRVASAAGLPLPPAETLDAAWFYAQTRVLPLSPPFPPDTAHALGMLFCQAG